MKVIYVNKPLQDENTLEPQIIDCKIHYWCVRTERIKLNQTLHQFLDEKWEWIKNHTKSENVEGFFLYDVIPVNGIIDKDKNFTGESAMMIRFDYIKKSNED